MNQDTFDLQIKQFVSECVRLRPEFGNEFIKWPILNEDKPSSDFDPHYLYHVAWAIRKVKLFSPDIHTDFSSSLNFCSTVSAICKTKFYDFRTTHLFLDNLDCGQCDLSSENFNIGQYESVSCMHVVEHIGLGRYGDSIDVNGDLRAIANLKQTVMPNGNILFVVPCGKPKICFNAHRIYSAEIIPSYFGKEFLLQEFYFIPNSVTDPPLINPDFSITAKYDYGCGCFHFKRNAGH